MQNFDCNTFCDRAKELFKDIGQIELSRRIGISQGVISAIKNGKPKAPSADTVYRIAKAFNVSADWLLGMSNNKTTNQATKELCGTLGLNDIAIESLQEDSNSRFQDVINFLFLQHHYARNIRRTQKSDEFEKIFADRAENESSVLMLLFEFLSFLRAKQDLSIMLGPDGDLSIHKIGDGIKTLGESADLQLKIDNLKGEFAFVSLIETASNDVTGRIARTLNLISEKRVAKFDFEELSKEGVFDET